jgi:diacylglycerol O-acyltransferase
VNRMFLKPFDASWFYIETPDAPVHFGPLMILSPPPGASDRFIGEFVDSWRQSTTFAPPFNYLLHMNPLPSWEVLRDDQIDLEYHLRHSALPAPGGERELGLLISRLQSQALDRSRPLWEMNVIEGLEGGRFAIYMKFHHGQLDGVGAARLIGRIFSTDPSARLLQPPWTAGMKGNRAPGGATLAPATDVDAGLGQLHPGLIHTVVRSASDARAAVGGVRSAIGAVGSAAGAYLRMGVRIASGGEPELTGPFQAPNTIFNGAVSKQRRFATQHHDLARFKRIATAAKVSVNDVFLAIIGQAIRRYLLELGELPHGSVVGQVPVNVRGEDDTNVGNSIAFIFARLHTDLADPVERLQAVHASTLAGKSIHQGLPANAVGPFTMMLTGPQIVPLLLGFAGRLPPAANLVISNVPGPPKRLYFNGARVDEMYGPSVIFDGQALNITMSSYAGQAVISYTACRDVMPSMQRLAVYTGDALDELESAVIPPPDKRRPARTPRRSAATARRD